MYASYISDRDSLVCLPVLVFGPFRHMFTRSLGCPAWRHSRGSGRLPFPT